jgi:hypothetical protein
MQYTSGTDMASWAPGRSSPSTGRDRALNVESGSTVESQRSQVLEFAMAEGDPKITIFLRRLLLALLIFFFFSSCFLLSPGQASSALSPVLRINGAHI